MRGAGGEGKLQHPQIPGLKEAFKVNPLGCIQIRFTRLHLNTTGIVVVGRLPEKPKNRPKIPKPEPNRNRKLQIFQKPNRTETEFKNRG